MTRLPPDRPLPAPERGVTARDWLAAAGESAPFLIALWLVAVPALFAFLTWISEF